VEADEDQMQTGETKKDGRSGRATREERHDQGCARVSASPSPSGRESRVVAHPCRFVRKLNSRNLELDSIDNWTSLWSRLWKESARIGESVSVVTRRVCDFVHLSPAPFLYLSHRFQRGMFHAREKQKCPAATVINGHAYPAK